MLDRLTIDRSSRLERRLADKNARPTRSIYYVEGASHGLSAAAACGRDKGPVGGVAGAGLRFACRGAEATACSRARFYLKRWG